MTNQEDWTTTRLVVVDVEGNGRQPPDIVELAIVSIRDGKIEIGNSEWLIRPIETITPEVIKVHGITNDMVAAAPCFDEVASAVRDVLQDDFLVAHHARVELDLLVPRLPGWKPKGVFDTLELARRFMPSRNSYSLTALVEELSLSKPAGVNGPHRALYDALMTAQLFLKLAHTPLGTPWPISSLVSTVTYDSGQLAAQGNLF